MLIGPLDRTQALSASCLGLFMSSPRLAKSPIFWRSQTKKLCRREQTCLKNRRGFGSPRSLFSVWELDLNRPFVGQDSSSQCQLFVGQDSGSQWQDSSTPALSVSCLWDRTQALSGSCLWDRTQALSASCLHCRFSDINTELNLEMHNVKMTSVHGFSHSNIRGRLLQHIPVYTIVHFSL